MSAYFTSERTHLPKNYFNKKELRAGYLLYFVMTNFLKVKFCLEQVNLMDDVPIRILDLGCGPGTASLACAEHFKGRKLEITAIDQNTGSLHDAKHLFEAFAEENASFKTIYKNILPSNYRTITPSHHFNIIIASNFLSELGPVHEQAKLVETLLNRHLAPNGIIIIIEPALRWTTRNLMKLRDQLLKLKHLDTYALTHCISPCLHNFPCPMLRESDRDWCHMYLDWQRPKVIEEVDKLIGNRKDYLKFSYLILKKRDRQLFSEKSSLSPYRAVSSPMRSKGKTEILLCSADGKLLRVTRLDKDIGTKGDIGKIKRGDLLKMPL